MGIDPGKGMDGLDGECLALRLEHVREGAADHAGHRVTGRAGHDQPRAAVRSEDKDAVDRAVIDGRPGRVLRAVGRELKGSGRVRGECGRDLLKRGRRPDESDLDVVRLRILDRRTDKPDQRHQDEQATDQWPEDRLRPCAIHDSE